MTEPAEKMPQMVSAFIDDAVLQREDARDEKIDLISQRVEWICQQLMAVMQVAQSNPMFRMAMAKAQKGANNA